MEIDVKLGDSSSYELTLKLTTNDAGNEITKAQLAVVGGPELLALANDWRAKLTGSLDSLEVPEGNSMAELVLREAILKAKNQWTYPFSSEELCHCRGISLAIVDEAIVHGAHTPEKVSEQTSASTSCGSCRPDVEDIIAYRLQKPS